MPPKVTLNPAWPQYVGILSIIVGLFAGFARYALLDTADPIHCNALIAKGSWLDSTRGNWQPDGCILHQYTQKESSACLDSRDVVFVGDSVTRKLFFQLANILDPALPTMPADDGKHSDHQLRTKNGTEMSFFWDPFLNGTYIRSALAPSRSNNSSRTNANPPALLALGSGLWYLRYANSSGGMPAWEANMENVFKSLAQHRRKVADTLVMLPVEQVVPLKLSAERAVTMHPSDIDAMNSDLYHRINHIKLPAPRTKTVGANSIYLPLAFNKMLDTSSTEDGLHYSNRLIRSQATILLNLQCNDVLPKRFPFDKTCCSRYPWPNSLQAVVLLSLTSWGPWMYYRSKTTNPGNQPALPTLIVSAGIALIYLSDRSWYWLKEQKQFDPWVFMALCSVSLACGLATVRRSDKDLGFLNRDQTDEWKGWMQLAILIYHYLGASKISGIYNPIRVLVASYLFMTGYGHTTFYLRKADFAFLRVAQVMIRLNFLTILLAYTMNTDYISYYFPPLVSMWYLIIYFTMAIGAQLNGRTPILLAKIFLSAAVVTWFMRDEWRLQTLFACLERVFSIHWSAREWSFRVNLDLWIVYAGMLTSITVIKIKEHRLTEHHLWPSALKAVIGLSALTLTWFFTFELYQESKFTYNTWHPYISCLPVMAFIILRNATTILRSASSGAFAFIGKCSLETFIVQYHFWLAADTKGVLLVIPGTHWRPVNFIIATIMFIYLSDRLAFATGEITSWICNKGPRTLSLAYATLAHSVAPSFDNNVNSSLDAGQELSIPLMPPHSLKDSEGNPLPEEPDTPSRSPPRWFDRLFERVPSSVKRSAVSSTAWVPSLKGKVSLALCAMWLLNVLWTYA